MKAAFLCYTQKSSQHSSKGLPSPKTNTAAEKRPGPKRKIDKIVSNHHLLGAMLVSGSVYFLLLDKCSSLCLVHFGAASKIPLGQHTTHTHTHLYRSQVRPWRWWRLHKTPTSNKFIFQTLWIFPISWLGFVCSMLRKSSKDILSHMVGF